MRARRHRPVLPAILLLAACGGGQPAPSGPPSSGGPPAGALADAGLVGDASSPVPAGPQPEAGVPASALDAGLTPGQKSWTDMSRDERLALMKTAVLPEMKKDFQAFSAKEFASFSCETCHGSGTKQGKFDMPNPELPKLDANGGFKRAVAKRPDMLKFMEHTVVPHMADILGLPQWEQSHATGFGCGNCHAMN